MFSDRFIMVGNWKIDILDYKNICFFETWETFIVAPPNEYFQENCIEKSVPTGVSNMLEI